MLIDNLDYKNEWGSTLLKEARSTVISACKFAVRFISLSYV